MKKTLIALAALAATGAFAQSSVTLYGVADVAIAATSGVSATSPNSIAAAASSMINNGNSRIGFKSVEDLGGGLKATVNFEGNINLANGNTDSASVNAVCTPVAAVAATANTPAVAAVCPTGVATTTSATTFSRMAYVSVSGGFGEVSVGRKLSPQFYAITAYELTGAANYSVIANKFGYGGAARNNAMASYTSPSIAGFTATLGAVLPGNTPSAGNGGLGKTEFNVIYKNGPLAAALGYDKTDVATGTTGYANMTLGASYNLGVAKVAASYHNPEQAEFTAGRRAANGAYKKGYTLGVSMPLGATTLTADFARDNGSNYNSTDMVFEAKYALSKNTFVYGVIYRAGETVANTDAITTTGAGLRVNF